MNKKVLSAVIAIPLAIALIIGIIYAALASKDDDVPVSGISFNLAGGAYLNDENEKVVDLNLTTNVETYQLAWTIFPAKAAATTDVVITVVEGAGGSISVSDTGLVTATEAPDTIKIKISTVQSELNRTVFNDFILINATTNAPQAVYLSPELDIQNPTNSKNFIVESANKVILFKGLNYEFGNEEIVNLSSSESSLNVQGNSIAPNSEGTFTLTIGDGTNEKEITVTVEALITSIGLPNKLLSVDGQLDSYYVGSSNSYNFGFVARTVGESAVVVNPNINVYAKVGNGSEILAEKANGVLSINNVLTLNPATRRIQFSPALLTNQKVMVRVESVRNPSKDTKFTFTVNKGFNADSDAELKALFNDTEASLNGTERLADLINITNSITAVVPDRLLTEDKLNLKTTVSTTKGEFGETVGYDGIYRRNDKYGFVINGNKHTINASDAQLKILEIEGGKAKYSSDSLSVFQFGIFCPMGVANSLFVKPGIDTANMSPQDVIDQRAFIESLYAEAAQNKMIINDLTIIGNSPNTDDNGNYFYKKDSNGDDYYAGYRGLIGISPGAANFEINNVNLSKFMIGVKTPFASYEGKYDNVDISNCTGYGIYVYRTAKTTIKDCSFSNLGHAAVYIKSGHSNMLADRVTPIDPNWTEIHNTTTGVSTQNGNKISIEGNFYLNNWTDGTNPFIAGTEEAMIPLLLKQFVFKVFGGDAAKILKGFTTGEALSDSKFNFGIISESLSAANKPENKAYNHFLFNNSNGYSANHDQAMFWKMLSEQAEVNDDNIGFAMAIKSADESVNTSLICASANANKISSIPNYKAMLNFLSYFYIGTNPQAMGE